LPIDGIGLADQIAVPVIFTDAIGYDLRQEDVRKLARRKSLDRVR
jgi:hypothetical protein